MNNHHQRSDPDLRSFRNSAHEPKVYVRSSLQELEFEEEEIEHQKQIRSEITAVRSGIYFFLQDKGNFNKYLQAFVELVFPIERLVECCNEEVLLNELLQLFVGGLREEFIFFINKSKPTTLYEAMNLAVYYEDVMKYEDGVKCEGAVEGSQAAVGLEEGDQLSGISSLLESSSGVEEFSVNDYMKKMGEEKDYDEEVVDQLSLGIILSSFDVLKGKKDQVLKKNGHIDKENEHPFSVISPKVPRSMVESVSSEISFGIASKLASEEAPVLKLNNPRECKFLVGGMIVRETKVNTFKISGSKIMSINLLPNPRPPPKPPPQSPPPPPPPHHLRLLQNDFFLQRISAKRKNNQLHLFKQLIGAAISEVDPPKNTASK